MKSKLLIVICTLIFGASALTFTSLYHRFTSEKKVVIEKKETPPDIALSGATLYQHEPFGCKKLIVQGNTVEFFNGTNMLLVQQPHIALTLPSEEEITFDSRTALLNTKTGDLTLKKESVAHFNDLTLKGTTFHYCYKDQTLRSNKPLTITHPYAELQAGKSFIALTQEKIMFSGGVKTEFSSGSTRNDGDKFTGPEQI